MVAKAGRELMQRKGKSERWEMTSVPDSRSQHVSRTGGSRSSTGSSTVIPTAGTGSTSRITVESDFLQA